MRRYVVVEPDIYEKLTEKPAREIKKPEETVLTDLDRKMEEILRSSVPPHDKIRLYNEVLQKARFYENKLRVKPSQKIFKEYSRKSKCIME